jgi:hypothetical protein
VERKVLGVDLERRLGADYEGLSLFANGFISFCFFQRENGEFPKVFKQGNSKIKSWLGSGEAA